MTPSRSPRGRSRSGSRISPDTKLAVCHPPNAKSTGTIAAASAAIGIAVTLGMAAVCSPACVAPTMTRRPTARILSTISALWTLLPARTPRQLITVRISSVATASTEVVMPTPVSSRKYAAKVMATAAIPPVCVTSRSAQPYRNATIG
jgi:hypothetical protein